MVVKLLQVHYESHKEHAKEDDKYIPALLENCLQIWTAACLEPFPAPRVAALVI
jgi:hypothetical protein